MELLKDVPHLAHGQIADAHRSGGHIVKLASDPDAASQPAA